MNSLYRTPCTPSDCTSYTLDCPHKLTCDRSIKYIALKQEMNRQKAEFQQIYDLKAHGVDCVYMGHRDNKRVGQK